MAWAIRKGKERIMGGKAKANHSMIYVGRGRAASQSLKFEIVTLDEYSGCELWFWPMPFGDAQRDHVVAQTTKYVGDEYGYSDLAGYGMYALTGNKRWLKKLADYNSFICSEAVCFLIRLVWPIFGGEGSCLQSPAEQARWMLAQGKKPIKVRLV